MGETQKELAMLTWNMITKERLLDEIKSSLSSFYESLMLNNSVNEKHIHELKGIIGKIKSTHEEREWKNFQKHFDLLHSDFFKKIKSDYPCLNMSQIKLCGLIKMRMSTKEISSFLNLSVRGVETQKYRLRKKMNIDRQETLEDYLDTFDDYSLAEAQLIN